MATWNGGPTLPKVLDAYCRLLAPAGGWSLLIVDDGSDDTTREVVAAYAARLPLRMVSQARRGKNAALNLALQLALGQASAELFLFTDDDASPEPDWLLRMDECARAHPDYALFGGAIVPDWSEPPPPWVLRVVPLGITYAVTAAPDGPVFPGLVWGANMAVRRAVFEAGYRFDVAVGPHAGAYAMGSETEFNRRLGAAGYAAWFCNAARVGHFIRTRQVGPRFILQRAYRFGRGAQLQQPPDHAARLFGAPRWMLAKLGRELAGAVRALAARDWDALFLRSWEIQYLRGFIWQAWFGRGRRLTRGARVLLASRSGQLGGMELRMAQEARLLAAAGCHASVATPRFDGCERLAASLRADGVAFSVFDPPPFFEQWEWRRTNKLRARLLAARRLRRYRPDLVHVAFCWTSYGGSLLWLANHCRLPAVVSIHNAFPPVRFSPWHIPLYAQAFGAVRGVYAVSPSAMAHFMAIFSRFVPASARLSVIPNGVDTARFRPSPERRAIARARLGLAPDGLVIGAVARLAPQKRPEALLELFRALRNRFESLTLVLAGSGPLEAVLRAKVEMLGLGGQVVFAGQVEAVEELMPAFDLHLLLSRNEGFGIATIEAMACGVPAVGTDVPGTADILRGSAGGLLVPLDDQRATIEAVSALLQDGPRRAAMALQARAEVEASYTLAIMERRVREFYSGLLP
jgi:glycosyltransferase involved in cell wall biosynthesis